MLKCRLIDFLFAVFPLKLWQGFLIRRHIQKCPNCLRKLADADEVKPLLIQENETGSLEGIWPAVRDGLGQDRGEVRIPLWRQRKWVYASGLLVAALAGLIWLYSVFFQGRSPSQEPFAEQFQINFIEIENEPAQAYVFHPQDSNTYFVWVEKKS